MLKITTEIHTKQKGQLWLFKYFLMVRSKYLTYNTEVFIFIDILFFNNKHNSSTDELHKEKNREDFNSGTSVKDYIFKNHSSEKF